MASVNGQTVLRTANVTLSAFLVEGATTLTVSPHDFGFGDLAIPASGLRRITTGRFEEVSNGNSTTFVESGSVFDVFWKVPGGSNFKLEVYTDNFTGSHGLVDSVIFGANSLEVRFNTINFGIGGDINDTTGAVDTQGFAILDQFGVPILEGDNNWEIFWARVLNRRVFDNTTGFLVDPFDLANNLSGGLDNATTDNARVIFAVEVLSTSLKTSYSAEIIFDLTVLP